MLSTPDLSDLNPDASVLPFQFRAFGLRSSLYGPVTTIVCFEDNSRVKEAVAESGEGRVLLIDGGGSLAKALAGDLVAKSAMDNGWAGMVVIGAVRDVEVTMRKRSTPALGQARDDDCTGRGVNRHVDDL